MATNDDLGLTISFVVWRCYPVVERYAITDIALSGHPSLSFSLSLFVT
jgi:hypothetical protein